MQIKKRVERSFSEYSFWLDGIQQGFLLVGFSNYFEVNPQSGWGLIPTIYQIEGVESAQERLIQYLFRYVKSPVLARVSLTDCHLLEKFGFFPINESYWVWEPMKEGEDVSE